MPKYSLFLAIFPDHGTAQQIINLGKVLHRKYGFHGRLRPINHLHVTLLFLGHTSDVPEAVVETVSQVSKAITAVTSPFEIEFNRVLSFRGRPGNHPLVLADRDHENDGVKSLHGLLSAKFAKSVSATRSFVPHLTLLYDERELAPTPIEPVFWMVKEIVLICSEVGATKYHWLGRWMLDE